MKTKSVRFLFQLSVSLWAATLPAPAGLVLNPSFESNYNTQWPHYGGIDNWTGGSGVNENDGPFHNTGTAVPDGARIGFQQGNGTLSQSIFGLDPAKKYWLQFFYDSRNGGTVDLAVKWDDVTLDSISGIAPSLTGTYRFRNVAFQPNFDSGTLAFSTTVVTDSTLLLDAVCLVQRDDGQVTVRNPGFEAGGDATDPGDLSIAGWSTEGTIGIDTTNGPRANNGTIPEQDHVLYIEGVGRIYQTIRGLTSGESYTVSVRCNAPTGQAPALRIRADGTSIKEQVVTPAGGAAPYQTVTADFVATADTVELVLEQTVSAATETLLLDDVRIAGSFAEPLPPLVLSPGSLELAPGSTGAMSVTVSEERLLLGESVVRLRSANPGVADFANPDPDGSVTLTFPANQPSTTLTVELLGNFRGRAAIGVEDNGGHEEVQGSVNVNVVGSFVRNSSFEANLPAAGVGYGLISAWTQSNAGASGLNTSAMPFADNGNIPDRAQVAFIQGSATLGQTLYGLTSGATYWLQFHYNARNCCGATPSLKASIDGLELASITDIQPVFTGPYHFYQAVFTANSDTVDLEFAAEAGAGDSTLLLDGVSVVQRPVPDITVMNPSFEASGIALGVGYIQPGGIAGWTMTGGYGVNIDEAGPFTDNGFAGAQDRVLFLQNTASAAQLVGRLTPGADYTLTFLMNARQGDAVGGTPYQIVVDGEVVEEGVQDPVGSGAPYTEKSFAFSAFSDTALIEFRCIPAGNEDQTLLVDEVRITPGAAPTVPVTLTAELLAGNSLVLRWPASSPASLELSGSGSLLTGSWTPVLTPVSVINGQNTVVEPLNGPRRFYRLIQP